MGGRTSTAVDEDAKQGENFTWPKRKIFSNNISGLLPVTQVRRLQITKNQRLTSQGFPRMITIGWEMAISMLCRWSVEHYLFFFNFILYRSDSGLLKRSESFVKKLWRRTRLGQCLWCTRSNFLQSRTHWSQGARDRHVTRRRTRPPMPPFRKLGHCTYMLHSNHLPMTTLFTISINDYNKTGYLVFCFYKSNKSPTSFISFSSWVATLALSITMSI